MNGTQKITKALIDNNEIGANEAVTVRKEYNSWADEKGWYLYRGVNRPVFLGRTISEAIQEVEMRAELRAQ